MAAFYAATRRTMPPLRGRLAPPHAVGVSSAHRADSGKERVVTPGSRTVGSALAVALEEISAHFSFGQTMLEFRTAEPPGPA